MNILVSPLPTPSIKSKDSIKVAGSGAAVRGVCWPCVAGLAPTLHQNILG